jgi:hypothetical protein
MEIGAVPRFYSITFPKPLSPSYSCHLPPIVVSLSETYILDADLLILLSEMTTHATCFPAVDNAPSLQYRLLSLYTTHQDQFLLRNSLTTGQVFCNQTHQVKSEVVQDLLLIGALLFLSLAHNLELPPIRPVDYGLLLSRLETVSNPLYSDHQTLLHHPEFLLWLCFLGEICSALSISASTRAREHAPSYQQLRAISTLLDISTWKDMQMALDLMWAIDPTYEEPYRRLWEDAMSA